MEVWDTQFATLRRCLTEIILPRIQYIIHGDGGQNLVRVAQRHRPNLECTSPDGVEEENLRAFFVG